ncbi:hypothetical protein OY671_009762, partial [Metschnikowia pulcherrima]
HRYPQRQHHRPAPRRPLRTGAAVPASWPGGARQAARLCLSHLSRGHGAVRSRGKAAEGTGRSRFARRRLPARQPRSGPARRGQPAGRRAIGPYQGSGLRTLPVDAGRGDHGRQGRWPTPAPQGLQSANHHRRPDPHSRGVCARSRSAHGPLPPPQRSRRPEPARGVRRRTDRPFRQTARSDRKPDPHHRDQAQR